MALQVATRGGHIEIVQLLLQHGADVHIQGGLFGNALEAAYSRDNIAVVEILEAILTSENTTNSDVIMNESN
jgi:ankyrin repeat protein